MARKQRLDTRLASPVDDAARRLVSVDNYRPLPRCSRVYDIRVDLLEAIDRRQSRRKYVPTPLTERDAAVLTELIAALNDSDGVRMELVVDNGSAFDSLRRSYGMFTGVRNYVGLIADGVYSTPEKLGFDGELVNLTAVTLGLGTCIVGGSFSRSACPFDLKSSETVACVIVVGEVEPAPSTKEKLLRGAMHRRSKTLNQLSVTPPPWPDWFNAGLVAVQKAPSALNRQPVVFALSDGRASASIPATDDPLMFVDLGIAKRHFGLGAGDGTWDWGSGGVFTPGLVGL